MHSIEELECMDTDELCDMIVSKIEDNERIVTAIRQNKITVRHERVISYYW